LVRSPTATVVERDKNARAPGGEPVSPAAVRGAVIVVCVGGIAGMIVGSIADNNAVALTFGLVTAAAVGCLIVVTAVTAPTAARTDERAERVEDLIQGLVSAGADEDDVRSLVREAVRLGAKVPGRGARRTHP
jgi:hypothetical protein